MSDADVYLVQCCHAADIQKTIGPFGNETTANIVADVIADHFHNGGDLHVQVEPRTVV